jgi:hypothetical protein
VRVADERGGRQREALSLIMGRATIAMTFEA